MNIDEAEADILAQHAPALRVLVVHNAYRERGGEDAVVEAEIELLRSRGHAVSVYARDNAELASIGSASAACAALWSMRTAREISACIREFRPDVVHAHNTFPLISPSLYWAAASARVPVVQTLHNFRLLCPQAMLLREGKVCEDCIGRLPWRGVARRCYRGSAAESAVLAGTIAAHRWLGTWTTKVARYVALSEFCRHKFVDGGLPARKVVVKPNFCDVAAPSGAIASDAASRPFLFAGRLSPEKGIGVLAAALERDDAIRVRIAGEGRSAALLARASGATLLGALTAGQVRSEMQAALALVLPSICYENFPRTLVEAYANALPVIASGMGSMVELVRDGVTGLLFDPGSAADLAAKLAWARSHPDAMRAMGSNARREYEARYAPEINYRQLIAIYRDAIREAGNGVR